MRSAETLQNLGVETRLSPIVTSSTPCLLSRFICRRLLRHGRKGRSHSIHTCSRKGVEEGITMGEIRSSLCSCIKRSSLRPAQKMQCVVFYAIECLHQKHHASLPVKILYRYFWNHQPLCVFTYYIIRLLISLPWFIYPLWT
jgi:hypothetical protein